MRRNCKRLCLKGIVANAYCVFPFRLATGNYTQIRSSIKESLIFEHRIQDRADLRQKGKGFG